MAVESSTDGLWDWNILLEQTQWNVSGKNSAAEILGLDSSTLRARMRKLGIKKP